MPGPVAPWPQPGRLPALRAAGGADSGTSRGPGALSRPLLLLISLLTSLAALLAVGGCASQPRPLLAELWLSSPSMSATGTGDAPPIAVRYALSRPASVTAYIISESGSRADLRVNEHRPASGEYVLPFDGTHAPDPDKPERRVLPSGRYRLVVEAQDAGGASQQRVAEVEILQADTTPPKIEGFVLIPETITPDFDGLDDVARISCRISKPATVTAYLISEAGKRHLLERQERRHPGEYTLSLDGQVGSRLLPSGDYRFVLEARDAAGNITAAERSLRLEASSHPDGHLVAIDFQPRRLMLGNEIRVEIRVRNTGNTVLRSQGPEPGHLYGSHESYGTVEGGAHLGQRGFWRVGVDWSTTPGGTDGSRYPYRWGLGRDLLPGEEATVVGYIRMDHRHPELWLHAALIQEQVRYWDDQAGRTTVEIGY